MILPLRQRHRRVFAWLAVLLPITFVVGIAARKPIPFRDTPLLTANLRESQAEVWNRRDMFPGLAIGIRLLRGPMGNSHSVEFLPGSGFAKPDVLVYWVAGTPAIADKLPDNAWLLGAFNPSLPLQLSNEAFGAGGVLVLYSLADNEIVGVSRPTRFNASTN